eukprot:492054-Pyramimonas_sp.AAC.1
MYKTPCHSSCPRTTLSSWAKQCTSERIPKGNAAALDHPDDVHKLMGSLEVVYSGGWKGHAHFLT